MKLKFLFFITWLLCFNFAMAQSPGGVSAGLKAWYKANAHTAQPSGWPDQSGNAKHLISGGVNPTWTAGTATFNFNPVFNFTGASNTYFYTTSGIMGSTTSAGSVFGVAKNNGTTGWQTLYGFGDDDPNLQQQTAGLTYNIWRDNWQTNSFGTGINTSSTHIPNMFWNASGGTQGQHNGTILINGVNLAAAKAQARVNGAWVDISDDSRNLSSLSLNTTAEQGTIAIMGAGTSSASGVLVLEATDKALVLPKVANAESEIKSPVVGTMVYDLYSKSLAIFDGAKWNFWK